MKKPGARIGATRTRTSIANYFNGTATDLGLVRNGVLVQTGETLAQVQQRVLGDATSAPLFTSAPGFVVLGARAGVRLSTHLDATSSARISPIGITGCTAPAPTVPEPTCSSGFRPFLD